MAHALFLKDPIFYDKETDQLYIGYFKSPWGSQRIGWL